MTPKRLREIGELVDLVRQSPRHCAVDDVSDLCAAADEMHAALVAGHKNGHLLPRWRSARALARGGKTWERTVAMSTVHWTMWMGTSRDDYFVTSIAVSIMELKQGGRWIAAHGLRRAREELRNMVLERSKGGCHEPS